MYIKFENKFYTFSRETKAFIFLRELNKKELNFIQNGVTYLSFYEKITFYYYDTTSNVSNPEIKINKKFIKDFEHFENLNNEDYFMNGNLKSNYDTSLFNFDTELLKSIYNFQALLYSLDTGYILNGRTKNNEILKTYNELKLNFMNIYEDKFIFNIYKTWLIKEFTEDKEQLENILNRIINE